MEGNGWIGGQQSMDLGRGITCSLREERLWQPFLLKNTRGEGVCVYD